MRNCPLPGRVLNISLGLLALLGTAVASSAHEALVTDQPADSLSFVDLEAMKETGRVQIGGKPAGIALSPDKSKAYITAPDGKELVEVDAVSRAIKRRLVVGGAPLGIAAHPTRPEVYVADWYAHKVIIVDTDKLAVAGEIAVGEVTVGPGRHAGWAPAAFGRPRQRRGLDHRCCDTHAAWVRRGGDQAVRHNDR